MPEKLNEVLQKKMTRAEFLGLIGASDLSVVGITSLLKNLSDGVDKRSVSPTKSDSYGGSTYGGGSRNTR